MCPEGEYFSFVSSECIPVRKMCDGRPDASQGDDEFGCGKHGNCSSYNWNLIFKYFSGAVIT